MSSLSPLDGVWQSVRNYDQFTKVTAFGLVIVIAIANKEINEIICVTITKRSATFLKLML